MHPPPPRPLPLRHHLNPANTQHIQPRGRHAELHPARLRLRAQRERQLLRRPRRARRPGGHRGGALGGPPGPEELARAVDDGHKLRRNSRDGERGDVSAGGVFRTGGAGGAGCDDLWAVCTRFLVFFSGVVG